MRRLSRSDERIKVLNLRSCAGHPRCERTCLLRADVRRQVVNEHAHALMNCSSPLGLPPAAGSVLLQNLTKIRPPPRLSLKRIPRQVHKRCTAAYSCSRKSDRVMLDLASKLLMRSPPLLNRELGQRSTSVPRPRKGARTRRNIRPGSCLATVYRR